ncbi:MAG: ABC transporter ATP-binding protein [Clostridium sp.]|nr:ABC transporter ATP-binding protein [Clostridium sp.]
MSWLEVRDLEFSYGNKKVFEKVHLDVRPGQIFCLVGPNGCGKTTLQHCLLGFLKPEKGSIRIDGRPLLSYSVRERAGYAAYVPQNHVCAFPYRALDVVAMGSIRGKGPFDLSLRGGERLAKKIMEQIGILELAEKEYTSLSGGELQMVLIARALCQQSDMLVLDEPTAHLDAARSQELLFLLSELAKRGKTILIATHDFNQPLFFEDEGNQVRMALMAGGRISDSDLPRRLLESGAADRIYGVHSRVAELAADKPRHYFITWK